MSRLAAVTPTTLISDQLQGSAYDLEIVTLNSDRYVVVYGRTSDTPDQLDPADRYDLQFEIRGMDGTQIVAPTRVTEAEGGHQGEASAIEGPDGVFAVAWRAANLTAGNIYVPNSPLTDTLRLTVFNPDGSVRTPEAVYEPGGTLPNWSGVAAGWTELAGVALPVVAGSAYGTALNPGSTDMLLLVPGFPTQVAYGIERAGSQRAYQIVDLPGPAMMFAWHEVSNGVASLHGGVLDVPGGAGSFGSEWFVPLASNGAGNGGIGRVSGDAEFEVIRLALGETVVSYYDNYHQQFRIFAPDGSGGGTPLYFAPVTGEESLAIIPQQPASAVAALPGGGFVAVWVQGGYTNAAGLLRPSGIWTRSYDALGNATGDGLLIRELPGSFETFDIDIDVSDDGSIVAGWRIRDGNSFAQFTETRVLREVVEVHGTPQNDTLAATHQPEDFTGLAGNDTVSYLAATSGVSASLAPGMQQTGAANEDRYDSIENLSGSNFHDDLRGDDLANVLTGLAGNDSLSGAGGNDTLAGGIGDDSLNGGEGSNVLIGDSGNDTLLGGDGNDTLNGGTGDDFLFGGATNADLRDVIYGGDGADSIDGGAGNDDLNGGTGQDTVTGGLGSDTLVGNENNDVLSGGGGSDLMYGNAGDDFFNGGFGYDRMNGGTGADSFYHLGIADHASDWIQDYNAAEGDVLVVGLAGAARSQFQVNRAFTAGAGDGAVQEAFIIYRPTGQILWALVDGGDDAHINIQIGGAVFDLLA